MTKGRGGGRGESCVTLAETDAPVRLQAGGDFRQVNINTKMDFPYLCRSQLHKRTALFYGLGSAVVSCVQCVGPTAARTKPDRGGFSSLSGGEAMFFGTHSNYNKIGQQV